MKTMINVGSSLAAVLLTGTAFGQSCSSAAGTHGLPKTIAMTAGFESTADIVDTAVKAGSFKTLAAALQAAGLVDTLKSKGPFTVFAPTDEAFAKLPQGTVDTLLKPENRGQLLAILTYHVVPGSINASKVVTLKYAATVNGQRLDIAVKDGGVRIDGRASVVKTDIECTNGVIHVIDEVIMPVQRDVLAVAADAGSFTTLAAAINAAGLAETLKGKGPFTIFAPTDEAFQKLPAGTIDSLLKPENKSKLASILTFHVIPGALYADQVVALKESMKTVQGQTFSIKVKDGRVTIGNAVAVANVTATDTEASNGVIHVIDTVLMPR